MDNSKDNFYYAAKALENIKAIQTYIANKSYEEFLSDIELIDAIMFRLIQLVENIKNITSDFKKKHKEIPLGQIMGFRNGIVHEYGKTDYLVVYEIVTEGLQLLKESLEQIWVIATISFN